LKNIFIIATLDTKGEEVNYLKGAVFARGHNAIVVDVV
jgi:uncharacterized protein (UPF0261 family)